MGHQPPSVQKHVLFFFFLKSGWGHDVGQLAWKKVKIFVFSHFCMCQQYFLNAQTICQIFAVLYISQQQSSTVVILAIPTAVNFLWGLCGRYSVYSTLKTLHGGNWLDNSPITVWFFFFFLPLLHNGARWWLGKKMKNARNWKHFSQEEETQQTEPNGNTPVSLCFKEIILSTFQRHAHHRLPSRHTLFFYRFLFFSPSPLFLSITISSTPRSFLQIRIYRFRFWYSPYP